MPRLRSPRETSLLPFWELERREGRGGMEAPPPPQCASGGPAPALLRRDAVLQDLWVRGEVSNFRHHSSGHMYFDIKDAKSLLKCVMFREANRRLGFRVEDGLRLLLRGSLIVYERRGEYELRVVEARPEGLGALFLAFEQLKRRLEAEGLFDPALKRPLPLLPKVIGVVTSPTGAVLHDIREIILSRFPNAHLLLAPARVQGEGAAAELAEAIRLLSSLEEGGPDVIVLARGGGSLEDLWAFNEEVVARAIRASAVPVVSAVGHETDFTISDFAADVRAPTPSKAAELVVPNRAELEERILALSAGLRRELVSRFEQAALRTDELSRRLLVSMGALLTRRREALLHLRSTLEAMSPQQVLARGYSITLRQATGAALRDPDELRCGEELRTILHRGEVLSRVASTGPSGMPSARAPEGGESVGGARARKGAREGRGRGESGREASRG